MPALRRWKRAINSHKHLQKRLQVWDARKLKSPLAAFADLPAAPQAQCCFSPDESLIATGTANVPGARGGGALVNLPFNACL